MADPLPVPSSPVPRRKRRWLRRALLAFLLLLVLLWLVKVPLTNAWLRRLPGDWDITITGVRPGWNRVTLKGVRVMHRPSGRQLGIAAQVEAENGWSRILNGELGTLTLTRAEVSWREEFETPYEVPPPGGPPAHTVVAWDAGRVHGGIFTWYETGREVPRLSLKIARYDGDRFEIYNDGRVEAAAQRIALEEVESREFALEGALEIESRSPQVEGVLTAQRTMNRYHIETVHLKAPECRVVWHSSGTAPPAAEEPGVARPDWDQPVAFLISQGSAEPGRVSCLLRSLETTPVECGAALTQLETREVQIGGGRPFMFGMTKATLTELKSPGAIVAAREIKVQTTLDEETRFHVDSVAVKEASVADSTRLLLALGFPTEQLKSFLHCRGGFDAKGSDLLIGRDGITSSQTMNVEVRDFSAILPGGQEPIFQAERASLSAIPSEVTQEKRIRAASVEKAVVRVTENVFTDELNPLAGPSVPAPPSAEKPRWYGWHADALTVRGGRIRGVDLGTGIPDATGDFRVETVARDPGGEKIYRIHIGNIALTNPLLAAIKVESVMDLDVHPVRVWETESVDEVKVNGAKVQLHEAFLKVFEATLPPPPPPAPIPQGGRE